MAGKFAILTQNTPIYDKKWMITFFLKKNANFLQNIGENHRK
jgi:hypothetical protein